MLQNPLDLFWGSVNTAVLLTSSLTMALAANAAERGLKNRLVAFLSSTLVLGGLFVLIKGMEYRHKYLHGLMPLMGLPF